MEHAIQIRNLSKSYKDFQLKNLSLDVPSGTVMGLIGANGAGKSTLINSIHAIQIRNLSKSYKDFQLKNLSLDVPSGTVMGLIGANGAGKSTLINSILGLHNADYEKLSILGKDLRTEEKEIKEKIAVIFDVTHYNLEFTPAFIGKLLSKFYKNWDQNTYEYYLKKFDLPLGKKLKQFSKGMKMKLEFAAAFSHHPKLLILDEATSGLDPIFREEILDIIREYTEDEDHTVLLEFAAAFSHHPKLLILDEATSGLDPIFREEILDIIREYTEDEDHTVLLSSHITSDLDKIADYIAFIHEGKLLFVKTYDEIQENLGILHCGKDILDALNPDDIIAYRKEAYGYRIMIQNKQKLCRIFRDLKIENASIEDLMLFYVKGEKVTC